MAERGAFAEEANRLPLGEQRRFDAEGVRVGFGGAMVLTSVKFSASSTFLNGSV